MAGTLLEKLQTMGIRPGKGGGDAPSGGTSLPQDAPISPTSAPSGANPLISKLQGMGKPEGRPTPITTPAPKDSSLFGAVKGGIKSGTEATAGFFKGLGKSAVGTVAGAAELGIKGMNVLSKAPGLGFLKTDLSKFQPTKTLEEIAKPKGTAEQVGKTTGDIAQFFVGAPELKGASVLTKSVINALDFGARTAVQTGGDVGQTKGAAITGAVTPPIFKAVEKAAPHVGNLVAEVLSKMSGVNSEAIKRAFSNPTVIAQKMSEKLIPEEVRTKAVNTLQKFRTDYLDKFEKGLGTVKGGYDYGKTGKILVGKEVNDTTKGIPSIFRKFAVSVVGGKLNFNKLNSSIVKGGEQKNLQAVYDTIRKQSDFSINGMQRVASRINALSSFAEGAKTESSAIISQIHNLYSKAIEKTYPELGKLRGEYATASKIYSEIDSVLKSSADSGAVDPTKVTTSIKKLSNLFNDNNEAYLRAIQKLEQVSGVDLLNDLAASSFRDISPKSFGSKLGEAALLTGGIFSNPLDLLVIPLFSPRLQGKLSTTAGKLAPYAGKTAETAVRAAVPKLFGKQQTQ